MLDKQEIVTHSLLVLYRYYGCHIHGVHNLGIYLDSDISMRIHVSKMVSSCFAALRQIRSIQRSVSSPLLLSLVASLILSRLDYGIAALASIPDTRSTSVSTSCCSTSGEPIMQVRSRVFIALGPSLVACAARLHQVLTGRSTRFSLL